MIWVVLPAGAGASAAIAAVRRQSVPHWRLLLLERLDGSAMVAEAVAGDARISRVRCHQGAVLPAGTVLGSARAADPVILLDEDCVLAPEALALLARQTDAALAFADEDRIDAAGCRSDPFHKPAWSIDLALEQDLAGAFCATTCGRLDPALDLSRMTPHGVALGIARPGQVVRHVPSVLCHRPTPRRLAPGMADVVAALPWLGTDRVMADLVPSTILPGRSRVRWRALEPLPRVSIIVPVRDNPDLLARCSEGVLARTDYPDFELIIADNGSTDPETLTLLQRLAEDPRVSVLPMPGAFNYSAINNAAVMASTGSMLVLLNSDVMVIGPEWLSEMVAHAMRPDVGAVGAKLLFENGTIQHAGVVLGVGRFEEGPGVAGHFGLGAPKGAAGYAEQFVLTREVSAVTAACLAMRRAVFDQVGGLDAVNLVVALNDVDLCLRVRALGLRIIWTPYAVLHHLESASRGSDDAPGHAERFRRECRYLRDRWATDLDSDPFYNVHFSRFDHSFLLEEPKEA